MYRVEDKYCISRAELDITEYRISSIMEPDSFGRDGYTVSSIYFDSLDDACYRESLDGNPFRKKYRIRIYNNSFQTIKLEVKCKNYNRSIKYVSEITLHEMNKLLDGETIDDSDNANTSRRMFNHAIRTSLLRPRVIVTYDRKAFMNEAGNVRVTIDRNLRTTDQIGLFGRDDIIYDYPNQVDSVLEVKYDEFIPKAIAQVIQTNRLCQTAYSKYLTCYSEYR